MLTISCREDDTSWHMYDHVAPASQKKLTPSPIEIQLQSKFGIFCDPKSWNTFRGREENSKSRTFEEDKTT